MNLFASIHGTDESFLDSGFSHRWKDLLHHSVRGFGYWVWKPQILLQTLNKLPENHLLLYADAGCHLNPGGRQRFNYYASHLVGDKSLFLFERGPEDTVRKWTKADLMAAFQVHPDSRLAKSPQIEAGVMVIRNTTSARNLLREWQHVYERDVRLIDDSPSQSKNHESFVEHRHDQAILTLLVRPSPATVVHRQEHHLAPIAHGSRNWSQLAASPIHARRDLQRRFMPRLAPRPVKRHGIRALIARRILNAGRAH